MKHGDIKALMMSILLSIHVVPVHAYSSEDEESNNHFAVGVGVVAQESPFKSANSQAFPLPLISIRQGAFYFETAETGFQFEHDMGGVVPSIAAFVAARATTGQDRERITADAGARLSLESDYGTLSGEYRRDITGAFKGSEFIARYSYLISLGKFTITPAVQGSWLNRNTANHMYGVTPAQRARMIANRRTVILPVAPITGSLFNLSGDMSATLELSERLTLHATLSSTYLGRRVRNSAAVERDHESLAMFGIVYNF